MSTNTKRILITGANKGIGRATVAAVLATHDDAHVLLGSRSKERGEAARDGLIAENPAWAGRIDVLEIDVASDTSVRRAAAQAADFAPLYAVVNNAGIGVGNTDLREVLETNTYGPHRVCEAFLPLLQPGGRIVNVSSASGPMFVAGCSAERQRFLTNPAVTWAQVVTFMEECLGIAAQGGDFEAAGLGGGNAYGLSKACLNAYTIALARENPGLTINACTPGYIETDLTRPYAEASGQTPAAMGMKPPSEGTRATLRLLFGDPGGSGWFFGSDAQRSPLDRYRSPGDPPYAGD